MSGASPRPALARARGALLGSCAVAAALALAGRVEAQTTGVATTASGNVTYNGSLSGSATNPGRVTVGASSGAASATINWTANGPVVNGATTLLPAGATLQFDSTDPNFIVLNRVNPGGGASAAPIRLDGTVNSLVTGGTPATGGTVWFYSPGGVVAGRTSTFNVGSLLLTASDLTGENGYGQFNRNQIRTVPVLNPRAQVLVENGARINANNPGSYVALLAPRVEQQGTVSVNGSAAYVAAQQASLTFQTSGLFDITVQLGTTVDNADDTVLSHTGSTTGPNSLAGAQRHAVYMVAVPKNDAITMLVSGSVGFTGATTAGVEGGAIVLSGGKNIVSDATSASSAFTRNTPALASGEVAQASTLLIGTSTFASPLDAFATASVRAGPALGAPSSASLLTTPSAIRLQGDATLASYGWTALDLGAGASLTASGSLALQVGGASALAGFAADGNAAVRFTRAISRPVNGVLTPYVPFGTAALSSTGGNADIAGSLTLDATGARPLTALDEVPSASVSLAGAILSVGGQLALLADQLSAPGATGGSTAVTLGVDTSRPAGAQTGSVARVGGLYMTARSSAAGGGDATGGLARVALTDSGLSTDSIYVDVGSNAGSDGTDRFNATGGTVQISTATIGAAYPATGLPSALAGVARGLAAGSLYAYADATGGSNLSANPSGAGGQGTGGTIDLSFRNGAVSLGTVIAHANGYGTYGQRGYAGADGETGGAGQGGSSTLLVDGSSFDASYIELTAYGIGGFAGDAVGYDEFGYGTTVAGDGGIGGVGIGGTAAVELRNGTVGGNGAFGINLFAYGDGGEGGFAGAPQALPTQSFGNGGAGGQGLGGLASLKLSGATATLGYVQLSSTANGGRGGTSDLGTGGAGGVAGRATPDDMFGSFFDATAGTATVQNLTIGSDGFGGEGGTGFTGGEGGAGYGGLAQLSTGITLGFTATNLQLDAGAFGGTGGDSQGAVGGSGNTGGRGGDGVGGTIRLDSGSGGALTVYQGFEDTTSGTSDGDLSYSVGGGTGGSGASADTGDGGRGGRGGDARGVTIAIAAHDGGTIDVENGYGAPSLNTYTKGGTGGVGGDGTTAGGIGGDGGIGTGGAIQLSASGGTLAFASDIVFDARGAGGDGGSGGVYGNDNLAFFGATGDSRGGSVSLASDDLPTLAGGITGRALTIRAGGDTAAGSILFSSSGTRGSGIAFTSLNASARGGAVAPGSGIAFDASGGRIAFTGAGETSYVDTTGTARFNASGTGITDFTGDLFLDASELRLTDTAPAVDTAHSTLHAHYVSADINAFLGTGDIVADARSVIRADDTISLFAEGGAALGSLYGKTLVQAHATGNLSIVNATADAALPAGTTTLAAGEGASPGGTIDLVGGYVRILSLLRVGDTAPVLGPLGESDATVAGALTATNQISVAAGRDVILEGTANLASDNLVALRAGDDLIARPGAIVRAALNPIADAVDTGPRDIGSEAGLLVTAGGQNISYVPATGEFSSILLASTISAGARPIYLTADAIDASDASFTARTLVADVIGAPAPGGPASAANDGGLLSSGCTRGAVCLGALTLSNRLEIGGDPAALPTAIALVGGGGAQSALLVAQGGVSFGRAGATTSFTGADLLRVEARGGPLTLLGTATLAGGTVTGPNGGTVTVLAQGGISGASGTISSGHDLNLGVQGTIDVGSLITGGTINTVDPVSGAPAQDGAGRFFTTAGATIHDTLQVADPATFLLNVNGAVSVGRALNTAGGLTIEAIDTATVGSIATLGDGAVFTQGDIALGGASGSTLTLQTDGTISLAGTIAPRQLYLGSSDIVIDPAAQVGSDTDFISIVNSGSRRTFIGGGGRSDGYSLSAAEFARLSASGIQIEGAVETGYGMTLGALTIVGPSAAAPGGRVNVRDSLNLVSADTIVVEGPVTYAGATGGSSLNLYAAGRIDVVAPTGSLAVLDMANNPIGSLQLRASEVRVGSAAAIADFDTLPTTTAKSDRLAINDTGVVSDSGWLQGGTIDVSAGSGVYIQNSGVASQSSSPDARRGFTSGTGGFVVHSNNVIQDSVPSGGGVTTQALPSVATVVNGRIRNADGTYTIGREAARSVFAAFDTAGGTVSLDPDSTVNGCRIDLSCTVRLGAFQGDPTVSSGSADIDRQDRLDTITINGASATIDWSPYDTDGNGTIDFLPVGNTGIFQNQPGAGSFVVLNRVLPTGNRPIQFNGTVQSRLRPTGGSSTQAAGSNGGTVWFYSPGGIVAGPTAVFDVGSLLLSASPLTSGPSATGPITFGTAGGAVTIAQGAQLLGADADGYLALVGGSVTQAGLVQGAGAAILASGSGVGIARGSDGFIVTATDTPGTAATVTHTGATTVSGDVFLVAGNGTVAASDAAAGRDLILSSASGVQLGAAGAGRDIRVTTTGTLAGTSLASGRDTLLAGSGAVTLGTIQAGGAVGGPTLASLTIDSVKANGAIELAASGSATFRDLSAGTDLTLKTGGDLAITGDASAAGTASLTANRIFVASTGAIADLRRIGSDLDAASARLALNDRALKPEGYLRANRVEFSAANAVYVQNSGDTAARASYDARAGFTAGGGGVGVTATGSNLALVLNGRQANGQSGFTGGLALIPLVRTGGATLDPGSTVNGCIIAAVAACSPTVEPPPPQIVTLPQDFFPVQDVIETQLDQPVVGSAELGFILPPLIQFVDFTPRPTAPLIDEPVTGAANEDLWSAPGSGNGCAKVNPDGSCAP